MTSPTKKRKKMLVNTKNKTIKKPYKKLNCSPNLKKDDKNDFSCYSNSSILKLKTLWNKQYPERKITQKTPYDIWKQLQKNMNNVCDKESCWAKQHYVGNKEVSNQLLESFLPAMPEKWKHNPNEWLSNEDINEVLKKYEKAYKCFEFIGPTPIDYDYRYNKDNCICNKICNFNLNDKIKHKIYKIGIIFNLDPHYKGGSHWVSLFINIKKKLIFYFDSVGEVIPKQIMKFVNNVIEQGNQLSPPIKFNFDQNHPNEHQYQNSECGVYSLYFIISMLREKKSPSFFKTKKIKDNQIHKYRNVFFNYDL